MEENPGLQNAIDSSVGYFTARISAVSVTFIGGGSGIGVLYDNENGTRTYLNARRFELGVGLGVRQFRILVLFNTREAFEDFRRGGWDSVAGAGATAGTAGSGGMTQPSRVAASDVSIHILSEQGALIGANLRLLQVSTNHDLTHTGVSDVSIPNIGFSSEDEVPDDAPRVWDRALPFMAQRVVDLGYDLPMPYGIGLTYADVTQDMLLDNLKIGFDGSEKVTASPVSFSNASSESETSQIKLDAWLFPFMNVFVMFGTVDGEAPLDVVIDGDQLLADIGKNCSAPGPPDLACIIFEGKTPTLPITAEFTGETYGLGTVLAGGWNDYFVTVPISFSYADLDGKDTEGKVWSVAPRVGKVISTGKTGVLAVYLGGAYLDSEIQISGTEVLPGPGGLAVDYEIDQDNKDEWTGLVGANMDFTKRISLSLEYHGFSGSRESVIGSFVARF